ncbi:AAA family ATPase [Streptomyces sp. NPDC102278]|uniref:AAA family ATPase n=1 Tax=Streptomyces sp. NPDC102278 TaxID=3366152 RepID=UPI0038301426
MRHTGGVWGHAERNAGGPASLVGRDDELAALEAALVGSRLITLTGPGGVGKSRLVRQALETGVGDSFPDGVHRADLSPLPDDRLPVDTAADALDLADHTPPAPSAKPSGSGSANADCSSCWNSPPRS